MTILNMAEQEIFDKIVFLLSSLKNYKGYLVAYKVYHKMKKSYELNKGNMDVRAK